MIRATILLSCVCLLSNACVPPDPALPSTIRADADVCHYTLAAVRDGGPRDAQATPDGSFPDPFGPACASHVNVPVGPPQAWDPDAGAPPESPTPARHFGCPLMPGVDGYCAASATATVDSACGRTDLGRVCWATNLAESWGPGRGFSGSMISFAPTDGCGVQIHLGFIDEDRLNPPQTLSLVESLCTSDARYANVHVAMTTAEGCWVLADDAVGSVRLDAYDSQSKSARGRVEAVLHRADDPTVTSRINFDFDFDYDGPIERDQIVTFPNLCAP